MISSSPACPPKATPDTGSEWPGMSLMGRPCRRSHTISTSSNPPLTCNEMNQLLVRMKTLLERNCEGPRQYCCTVWPARQLAPPHQL
jgi:hypothetical protein